MIKTSIIVNLDCHSLNIGEFAILELEIYRSIYTADEREYLSHKELTYDTTNHNNQNIMSDMTLICHFGVTKGVNMSGFGIQTQQEGEASVSHLVESLKLTGISTFGNLEHGSIQISTSSYNITSQVIFTSMPTSSPTTELNTKAGPV